MESIPVLKLGPVLLVTVQTELNDRVVANLQEEILNRISATHATALMIDITALSIIDSHIARVLGDTAQMAKAMNAEVVLVGMQPAVALTLLEMGLELPDIKTAINVDRGLEELGYRLVRKNVEDRQEPIAPINAEMA